MSALFTMVEAAKEMRASRRWLQEYIKKNPYYRLRGNRKVFTAEDIIKLQEALPCPSTSMPPVPRKQRPTKSAEPTAASWWTEAQKLLKNEKPRKSSDSGKKRSNVVCMTTHAKRS